MERLDTTNPSTSLWRMLWIAPAFILLIPLLNILLGILLVHTGFGESAGLPYLLFWLMLPCSPVVGIIMLLVVLIARFKRIINLETRGFGFTIVLSVLCIIAPAWLIFLYPQFAAYFGR